MHPNAHEDVPKCVPCLQYRTWKLVAAKYPQPGSPKLLKWDKYFAYFNDHFRGIQEPSPPEGLKPFTSLWDIYKQGDEWAWLTSCQQAFKVDMHS
ncbi:hypothetical protein V8C86DRAFT_1801278 [Haematococcus lacustris]